MTTTFTLTSTRSRRCAARTFALSALAAAALAASALGAGAVHADQPAPGALRTIVAEGQTRITTDKASYVVGEPITVSYTLPGPGQIRITDRQGGQVSTLRSGFSAQTSGTIQGTVTPPTGQECLTLEYTPGPKVLTEGTAVQRMLVENPGVQNGPATAETCFQVTDKTAPKETPKDQGQSQGQSQGQPQGQPQGQGQAQSPVPAAGL
jgi:hypothetical protein